MAVTYYLGVDGGTTRTKAVVGDDAGHIIGSGEGGASNYQIVGLEAAMSGITDAVQSSPDGCGPLDVTDRTRRVRAVRHGSAHAPRRP